MNKNDLLEKMEMVKEILKGDFNTTTDEQMEALDNRFNRGLKFDYTEDGSYIFLMSSSSFKTFEYYYGMECEKDNIDELITIDDMVYVSYNYDSERAEEIFEILRENEQ